jgi:REP element-mobilizing transposase RayT
VLGDAEREQFRTYLRMYENFTGCRILCYCLMSNHFHVLLEVPPMPQGGLSDEQLLTRLRAIYSEGIVLEVAKELKNAREKNHTAHAQQIHQRYTYRMHDLSQFMKTVLQRMTRWFNTRHERRGTLWEERFKSVIVEDGTAARMTSAYIDLNPVRAGMVKDPAEYRWSSYGEAVGGGAKGDGKKAREGLVRACLGHQGVGFDAKKWQEVGSMYRKLMGMAIERKSGALSAEVAEVKKQRLQAVVENLKKSGAKPGAQAVATQGENETFLRELSMAEKLGHRMRYFTSGAVIGSREFVNEVFSLARERFPEKRKDGARKMKGLPKEAQGLLWSMRDLRNPIA